ncbi:MAG: 50S ribosomal protein L25 [Chloroflexi bacterium]|nr:50S ribosomal protein L25 [Chloroflexota bacterium]
METVALKLKPRTVLGKKVKTLRRSGITPLHLYGAGIEPRALQAEARTLRKTLQQVGRNIPVHIEVEGEKGSQIAFVREVQLDPITLDVQHVDLYLVDVSRRMEVEVPIEIEGEAPAARVQGGTLVQYLHTLRIECLPLEVPESIRVDVTGLDSFDKLIRVAELSLGPDVSVLTDPEEVVVRVLPPRLEEAPPVEAAAAPQEVEVVKPVRKAEEEGKEAEES